ncbi:MAG: hypothetical protein N2115_07335 [bacterium]|nr:hypothetical protein [bacterium]
MTSRERVLLALNHKEPDRIPMHDAPWAATIKRWKTEGLPEDMDVVEYFGWDFAFFGADCTPRFPVRTLEKNEKFIIQTTPQGGVRKNFRDYTTTPEVIDWPIKTKDDWKEIKKRLNPDFTRVDWVSALNVYNKVKEEGKFICYSGGFGYDMLQTYMKTEQLLITMVEDPDWIKEMIMTLAELNLIMMEFMMKNGFNFDGAFFYNDMGYKNASLFSPDTYLKTHYQADKMAYGYCHSKNMKVFLHSCGNVKELIPMLIDAGLDCLQPLEVKAGMDLIELKERYGEKLSFMGGIDTRLMNNPDKSKIENEIKTKIEIAKKNGGYIYHSDHSIPNTVSFSDYCYVMELVKKYGVYEHPEIPVESVQPAIEKKEETAEQKKKKFGFGLKKKTPATQVSPEEPVQEKPAKKGLFSKKEKKQEAPAPDKTQETKTEKKSIFGFLKGKKK